MMPITSLEPAPIQQQVCLVRRRKDRKKMIKTLFKAAGPNNAHLRVRGGGGAVSSLNLTDETLKEVEKLPPRAQKELLEASGLAPPSPSTANDNDPQQVELTEEEVAAVLGAVDTDGDGSVSIDELRAHMHQRGLAEAQVAALFAALDENADGKLSREELAAGLRRARTGEPALKELMAAVEPPAGVDFSDLATAPGGCFEIADTARRAISLEQMERIVRHVARRMGCELEVVKNQYGVKIKASWKKSHDSGERWLGSRPRAGRFVHVPISFAEVNLYDNARYVIGAATAAKQCSMVELMVSEEQPPDYFVCVYGIPTRVPCCQWPSP